MTTEEERLSEVLHRLTPEPPRAITVEDIAIRAGRDDHTAVLRIGRRGRMRWAPALAAASVVAVVGASAGIGVVLTSHHTVTPPSAGGGPTNTAGSTYPATSMPPSSSYTAAPPTPIADGIWDAGLIERDAISSDTLVGSGSSLYALSDGYLLRIDAASGYVLEHVRVTATDRPVVAGDTVWVAAPGTGDLTLNGYNATTLAPARTITVSGSGPAAVQQRGILAAGPGGGLYVAAGNAVAVVDPSSGSVTRRIPVSGQADSVAVAPDGSRLYAGVNANGSFSLVSYDPATGAELSGSAVADGGDGGYLVATPGGVWGTIGTGMTQRVWFAPGGNLPAARQAAGPANGGLDSVPAYANGVVWIGGIRTLECLDPSSGKVRASVAIPSDAGIPEHFGSVTYASGRAFAVYSDPHAQLAGVARLTPPGACAG